MIWAARDGDTEKLRQLQREGYDFNVVDMVSTYYTTNVTLCIQLHTFVTWVQ